MAQSTIELDKVIRNIARMEVMVPFIEKTLAEAGFVIKAQRAYIIKLNAEVAALKNPPPLPPASNVLPFVKP